MTGDPRPTQKRCNCNLYRGDSVEEHFDWCNRDTPPDAPVPLSRRAGEAVKRIVDSMETPDAQPEAGMSDRSDFSDFYWRTIEPTARRIACDCRDNIDPEHAAEMAWEEATRQAQPEAGEKIVLHRKRNKVRASWYVCHGHDTNDSHAAHEHAVWTRRKS